VVELSPRHNLVAKTTIPPAFGLIPEVVEIPVATARDGLTGIRKAIEFLPATPLEYLSRWIANNRIFGDDVKLASVILWPGGMTSFGITQPQYHGTPAEPRDIQHLFLAAGWIRLNDPSGHTIFYNSSFDILAIDAERRNCYLKDGELLPFDVILRHPDEALAEFLEIQKTY
jgi:hypothetical protein